MDHGVLTPLGLFAEAGPVAKAVMLVLLLASIWCWVLIVEGAWSVRLRPGGFHADHLHGQGWLSSACYIALPTAIDRNREGWIRFGRPGVPTRPDLPAEAHVKPQPGKLVLFPSYMWHGTEPFAGDQPRLTVAFDVVPA